MTKSFLGVGWAFDTDPNDPDSRPGVRLDDKGAILMAAYEEEEEPAPVHLDRSRNLQRRTRDASGFRLRHLRYGL
jgi:hypothetical protein